MRGYCGNPFGPTKGPARTSKPRTLSWAYTELTQFIFCTFSDPSHDISTKLGKVLPSHTHPVGSLQRALAALPTKELGKVSSDGVCHLTAKFKVHIWVSAHVARNECCGFSD